MHLNKIGRKLYYLKSTGEVVYNTGEAQGYVLETTLEQDIINGGLQNVPRSELVVKKLEFGALQNYFINFRFNKIDLDSKEIKFFNESQYLFNYYNAQKEKKEYSEKELYEMYNIYLEQNIRNSLEVDAIEFNWKTLDEIHIRESILDKSWSNYFVDDYLKDSSRDKMKLALDILENGTYWPIVVSTNIEDGQLYVHEGSHRIMSAKIAQQYGLWSRDKKVLCMEMKKGDYDNLKCNTNQSLLNKSIVQTYPSASIYDGESYNGEVTEKTVYTIAEFLFSNQIWPHWLRDLFYNFKKDNGRIIKPLEVFNDEEQWNKWKNEGVK